MRKVALLAAIALSALFANTSSSTAAEDEFYNLNKNTFLFLQGPGGSAVAAPAETTAPAAGVKVAKKKKSKK
jgi:hypothetical protein